MTVTYKFKYTWRKQGDTEDRDSFKNYNDLERFKRLNYAVSASVEAGNYQVEELSL